MKSFVTMINDLNKKIENCTKKVNQKSEQIDAKYSLEIVLLKMFKDKLYKQPDMYFQCFHNLDNIDKKYHPHDRILSNIANSKPDIDNTVHFHKMFAYGGKYINQYMNRYHISLTSINIICNYTIKLLYMTNQALDSHSVIDKFALDNEYEIMLKHLNKEDR